MSHDEQMREQLLRRDGMLIGIVALSLLNGMHFSPFFDPAYILFRGFAPALFMSSALLLFYFTSLMLATATLVLAGVPAALYERLTGRADSDGRSLAIWLAAAAVLALPSLAGVAGLFG